MHIPDGYMSPQTVLALGAAMVPAWAIAAQKVKKSLKARQVPLLAIGAAFSFTIMMYNIPIPDGTTAHAVGGTLLAVILGPWAAAIGVTIALAIQALFFGDGGIWAFGANAFNLALVLPFVGYYIYKLIAGNSAINSPRRWLGASVAGFVALNVAAILAGIEFGLQPLFFKAADGTPLYSPYPMGQAVAAMAFAHLLVAGPIEGLVTGFVVRYLQKANPALLMVYPAQKAWVGEGTAAIPVAQTGGYKKLWWGLGALIVLSPLGLLAEGSAWGEWAPEEIREMVGFLPQGMQKLVALPTNLFPDYTVPGIGGSFFSAALAYIFSAFIGLVLILIVTYLLNRFQLRSKNS